MIDNTPYPAVPPTPAVTRWLVLGAVAGPALFTLAWFVFGFLSPGYTIFGTEISPYSPISGLGLGPSAPFMNAAFKLSGILLMAGVIGVFQTPTMRASSRSAARWACAALLALSPLGLVVAGIFTLEDPLPHLIGFLLTTGTPVLSFLAAGLFLRGILHWRRFGTWLLLGSPLTLLLVVLFLTFDQATTAGGQGVAGLTQRILALEVLAWFAAMGWPSAARSGLATRRTRSAAKRYNDRETSILKEKEKLKGNHRMTNDHGDRSVSNHLEKRTPMHDETKANHTAADEAAVRAVYQQFMDGWNRGSGADPASPQPRALPGRPQGVALPCDRVVLWKGARLLCPSISVDCRRTLTAHSSLILYSAAAPSGFPMQKVLLAHISRVRVFADSYPRGGSTVHERRRETGRAAKAGARRVLRTV